LDKIIFWSFFIGICVIFLVLISDILAPFFIAFTIAYILQPLIDNNSIRYKLPRNIIAYGVFVIFLSIFILGVVIVLPLMYQQISLLVSKVPVYKNYLQTELAPIFIAKIQSIDPTLADKLKDSIQNIINSTFSVIALLLNNIWSYTMATINIVMIILLVPLILFYFLKDWPKMVAMIENLLPLKGKNKVREVLSSINGLLSAYIRGQLNVCLLLSSYYGIGLSIIGVDLGLLLGMLSGFLIIIPFIGLLIAFLLSIIIGCFTFGITIKLSYIVILYIVGYILESSIITPKIIGDKIGLHPLWIMFSVFASGSLFGFIGIFFAIPIAGIIKVLLKFAIQLYKSSRIYKA
jgi:putative permease